MTFDATRTGHCAKGLASGRCDRSSMCFAGVLEANLSDNVLQTKGQWLPWLVINLLIATLASLIITHIETAIESLVAFAVLTPIIASIVGNSGTQS